MNILSREEKLINDVPVYIISFNGVKPKEMKQIADEMKKKYKTGVFILTSIHD